MDEAHFVLCTLLLCLREEGALGRVGSFCWWEKDAEDEKRVVFHRNCNALAVAGLCKPNAFFFYLVCVFQAS